MKELTRTESMVMLHGETVPISKAAFILGVSRTQVYRLLAAGEINRVCSGTKVDVRSIARYIEKGKKKCLR